MANSSKGNHLQPQEPKHGLGDTGMNLAFSPSQTFVQDPRGNTHVLLFLPTDSIATNLLRYSSQLLLPPFADLYILSGSQVLQAECTEIENGLHFEPHVRILLRCRGGMRSETNGSSRDKGRGQRISEGSSRGMGGGQTTAENSRTPPVRFERGRGRGTRAPEARRHTLLHTQPQEDVDDISCYALVTARRETLRITTSLFCQQRWASSRTIPGYATPPPAAAQEGQPEDVPTEQERSSPSESISTGQAPPTPKTKAKL